MKSPSDSLPSQKHRAAASMRAQTQRSFPCRTSGSHRPTVQTSSDSNRFPFFWGVTVLHQALECFFVVFGWLHQILEIKKTSKLVGPKSSKLFCQILTFLLRDFVSAILGHTNTAKHSHEHPLISMGKNACKGPCSIVAARFPGSR